MCAQFVCKLPYVDPKAAKNYFNYKHIQRMDR